MISFRTLTLNLSTLPPPKTPNPNSTLRDNSIFFFPLFRSNSPQFTSISRTLHHFSPQNSLSSSEFPLLPFDADQVLVPSETKTLHLYEARFLALLEESLIRKKKLFVHFVLDPVLTSTSSDGSSFAARYGCLVLIENVERLEIGALISIRGIGRVRVVKFVHADPYLKGVVVPVQDNTPECVSAINSKIEELKEVLYSLNSLQIKLKDAKDEPLQTRITNSLRWAKREPSIDCDESFIPSLAERLSFAGLQPVSVEKEVGHIHGRRFVCSVHIETVDGILVMSGDVKSRVKDAEYSTGSSQSELLALQKEKLQAMEIKDTFRRLEDSINLTKRNISMVAAKLAIQSLEVK